MDKESPNVENRHEIFIFNGEDQKAKGTETNYEQQDVKQ